jgi:beta-carotene 3-hydroxylase
MMSLVLDFFVLIASFFAMEMVAWASHKYIMHGLGWEMHRDHHQPSQGTLQRNDLFFLLFAIPAFLAIYHGTRLGYSWMVYLGAGISLYGLCYFLVHDVFIHQRFPWFTRTDNVYFRAIRKAHKIHHKSQGKKDGECFGMLLVPIKYFRAATANQ